MSSPACVILYVADAPDASVITILPVLTESTPDVLFSVTVTLTLLLLSSTDAVIQLSDGTAVTG